MVYQSEAMVMSGTGGPDVLTMQPVDLPWPAKPDDVLVRLHAAGVNPADTFFRALGPYVGDAAGTVLGHDGAGIVEAVGSSVTSVAVGDRVCFCNGGVGGPNGTYARHAIVPDWLLAGIPDDIDFGTAAAVPLVFITGWEALVERVRVGQGETVLIHGGAGGTGQIAIQIALQQGARVAATVSSSDKADLVIKLGAERAINYLEADFVDDVRDWTGGVGLDVALDNAGPDVFRRSIAAMRPYGRLVTLMGMPGDLEDETAYTNNLTIHNVMMLTPMVLGLEPERRRQGDIVRAAMASLAEGRISVDIAGAFDLADAATAHARLEAGGMTGKIVLTM
ncbi:MAG: zinc-binding dehydrogenase [Alphaproteobacteria bacterium]